jgi:hypothetical protein
MVELNKGTGVHGKYDIHIQNPKLRLSISEGDFCKIAAGIIASDSILRRYKGLEEN